ncbi:MAG: SMC-Scp complex subunit ScpB [Gammaproteobacteria bacterium]
MSDIELKHIIEAALLAAARPLSLDQLRALFPDEDGPTNDELRDAVVRLQEDYAGRGIDVREVASGFRIQVTQHMEPWISRLWEERPPKYSRALLETLALIAYRQPITRAEIEDIRGVSVSTSIVKTLQEREWIRVVGHRDVPGRPAMYGTTREFLDYFDLKSLDELPTLAELRDIDSINAQLDFGPEHVGADAGLSSEAYEQASSGEPAASDDGTAISGADDDVPAAADATAGSEEDDAGTGADRSTETNRAETEPDRETPHSVTQSDAVSDLPAQSEADDESDDEEGRDDPLHSESLH